MSVLEQYERGYKKLGADNQRRYPNTELVRFLFRNFLSIPKEKRKDIRILELGSGSCGNLWMVAREGFDAYGIDVSPTGVKVGKEVLASWGVSAKLTVGDMTKLPYPDDYFDAIVEVVSLQCLDISGKRETLKEVHRCLKNKGMFYTYHIANNPPIFDDQVNYPLTLPQARKLLKENRFGVRKEEQFSRISGEEIKYISVDAEKLS